MALRQSAIVHQKYYQHKIKIFEKSMSIIKNRLYYNVRESLEMVFMFKARDKRTERLQ